jgi:hypothetical protein
MGSDLYFPLSSLPVSGVRSRFFDFGARQGWGQISIFDPHRSQQPDAQLKNRDLTPVENRDLTPR